jgi:hypothetical protein
MEHILLAGATGRLWPMPTVGSISDVDVIFGTNC